MPGSRSPGAGSTRQRPPASGEYAIAPSSAESLRRKSGSDSIERSRTNVRVTGRRGETATGIPIWKVLGALELGKRMRIVSSIARAVLLIVGLILAMIGWLTITRGNSVHTVLAPGADNAPPAVSDTLFAQTMALYTGTRLTRGNLVEPLMNGNETYPRLWRDIAAAQHTITVQMYYAQPGAVADTMCALLAARARAGVRVLVLLDAFGAGPLRRTDFVRTLTQAGARVSWLRPLRWYALNRAAMRSHNRIVVVDGHIGYTGGFGMADQWLGDGVHDDQWRESNVRFEGPAVSELQAAFVAGWAEASGILLTGDIFFPRAAFRPGGDAIAGLMHTVPSAGSTPAERYLALSIAGAQRSLYVTNSYFVPNEDFRSLLKLAVRRGVDVRVMTTGDKSDVRTTWLAGREYYEDLLQAGVKMYEYQPSMLHSKTLVADGVWAVIGSMNFDNRSMSFNNETTLIVLDRAIGAHMDSVFMRDLTHAHQITLAEFRQRGWWEKTQEWSAEKFWRVL